MTEPIEPTEADERLAAYAAGDLDAAAHAAVTSALAADPAMRARLTRIRSIDRLLANLPEIDPPDGFSERLHAAVTQELAQTPVDALAAARQRRIPVWTRRLAPVAAGLAIVAGVGIGVANLGGSDDFSDAAGDSMPTAEMAADAMSASTLIRTSGRDYDADSVRELVGDASVSGTISQELTQDEASRLRDENVSSMQFSGMNSQMAPEAPADAADDSASSEAGLAAAEPQSDSGQDMAGSAETLRATSDTATEAVGRCLQEVLAGSDEGAVPLLADVASYEGEPAVIYVLATRDPDSGRFSRAQIWIVAQSDCFLLNRIQPDS